MSLQFNVELLVHQLPLLLYLCSPTTASNKLEALKCFSGKPWLCRLSSATTTVIKHTFEWLYTSISILCYFILPPNYGENLIIIYSSKIINNRTFTCGSTVLLLKENFFSLRPLLQSYCLFNGNSICSFTTTQTTFTVAIFLLVIPLMPLYLNTSMNCTGQWIIVATVNTTWR